MPNAWIPSTLPPCNDQSWYLCLHPLILNHALHKFQECSIWQKHSSEITAKYTTNDKLLSLSSMQLPLKEIKVFFTELAKVKKNKNLVRFVPSIGKSFEGRSIFAVHITHNVKKVPNNRPKIYIQCLIHASKQSPLHCICALCMLLHISNSVVIVFHLHTPTMKLHYLRMQKHKHEQIYMHLSKLMCLCTQYGFILCHIFYSIGEWISGPVCMYLAHYLVKNQDAEVQ